MRVTNLTFNINFNDDETIGIITPEMEGEMDALLLCRFLNAVSNVRDQYNKEVAKSIDIWEKLHLKSNLMKSLTIFQIPMMRR